MCGVVTSETSESDQCLASQALAAAEQRAAEYGGLLEDAQLKFESVAKHRKSAQKQLDAQEEDLEHLGHRLKVFLPFPTHPITLCDKPPQVLCARLTWHLPVLRLLTPFFVLCLGFSTSSSDALQILQLPSLTAA